MLLTERDKEIVRWISTVGVSTRDQVQKLFFAPGSRSRCQRRLTLLYRNRYLDRLAGRGPTTPDVYCLTRRCTNGIRLLRAGALDMPKLRPPSSTRLQHVLAIISCRVQVARACMDTGIELVRWLDERDLIDLVTNEGIVPDAYFQLARIDSAGEKRFCSYFLEVERSGKSERALKEKLRRYGRFYYEGRFEDRFGARALKILWLLDGEFGVPPDRQLRRLAEFAAEENIALVRLAPLAAFVGIAASDALSTRLWLKPGRVGLCPLFGTEAPVSDASLQ